MQSVFIVVFIATLCLQLQWTNAWQYGLCKCIIMVFKLNVLCYVGANQMLHAKCRVIKFVYLELYCESIHV